MTTTGVKGESTYQLHGVHHVAVVVDDLDAARRFYCDLLGLSILPRPFEQPGMWLQLGNSQLHLIVGERADVAPRHVAYHVGGIDGLADHLEAAGVEVRRIPQTPGVGRQMIVSDPAGNVIELHEPIA